MIFILLSVSMVSLWRAGYVDTSGTLCVSPTSAMLGTASLLAIFAVALLPL